MRRISFVGLCTALSLIALSALAAAQEPQPLQRLKDLYASAAYEEALSVVTTLDATEPSPEIEQYRVFCLVALGRTAEAEKVVEQVITAHPRYHPDATDASPRIQELFTKVRQRVAPPLIKSAYVNARAALDRKDREVAIAQFEEMLKLADDPDVRNDPSVSELRLLGAGFLDLSKALAPKADAPAAPTTAPPAAAAAPVVRPVVRPPVAIRESLPPWVPTDPASRFVTFEGAIRVHIDAAGKVSSSEIVTPVHPSYDRSLLQASRDWVYQPATTNGKPVPFDKIVQVILKPR
jgi:hypothetical protein